MTPRQRAFIEAYAGNATEAAIKAGYSKKTAYSIGQELLKKPEISEAIRSRESEESRGRVASRLARQEFWTEVMSDAENSMSDRLRASELLARSEADFVEKKQVEHSGAIDLFRAEERAALLELIGDD